MRRAIFIFVLGAGILISPETSAQELNCTVSMSTQALQGVNIKIFETLQKAVMEFMNNTRWTNDIYKQDERIDCSILINITDAISSDEFKATIQVQSRRPVYKTSYNTVLINYNDPDFQFKYIEFQPIEFVENTNLNNLSSVLAYYAYMVIGLDYDTFSKEGGEVYFQKAMAIVNNNQNVTEKGWKAFENSRNRYWFVENLLNPRFKPMRECLYKYHRLGMDNMSKDMESARVAIAESLELVKKVRQDQPNAYLLQLFFIAKSDELVNIYSEAFPEVKTKMVSLLSEIDPANGPKYQKINQPKK